MNLFIFSSSPYGQNSSAEGLDAAMAFAAFGQPVSVLFTGFGTLQLLAQQQPQNEKNVSKVIKAFEMYEIDNVYANQKDFEAYELPNTDLCIQPTLLDDGACSELIQSATRVFRF